MSNAPDIVGIGVCTVDHLMTVPHMPGNNVNMKASSYLRQPGGLASCALVAAARLGARTKIIALVGDDADGQYIRHELESEGVDASQLIARAGGESHVSLILVDEGTGDRSIITRPPTGKPIALSEITREDITSAKALFIDDVTELTLQAARWAREANMKVVLDPARPYAIIKEILPYVDVPIVPQQWAEAWMPGRAPEAVAEALCEEGAAIAAVTLGARGSVVSWEGGTRHIPAFQVDVVDTTGAGDAYHGAFMAALLEDWEAPRMARFAAAVGSLNCRAIGGRTALPTRDEVDAFLRQFAD
ncbi:MAG: PfkB family carbohydrate kinase [Chloroflexota bacterium]|nr:PfkB family carbohydrate kinase [Chloroflexota bacterium]